MKRRELRLLPALLCLALSGCGSTSSRSGPCPETFGGRFILDYEVRRADASPASVVGAFFVTPTYFVLDADFGAAADGAFARGGFDVQPAARYVLLIAESDISVLPFVLPLASPLALQPWSGWLPASEGVILTRAEAAQVPQGWEFLHAALKRPRSQPPPLDALQVRFRVRCWDEVTTPGG